MTISGITTRNPARTIMSGLAFFNVSRKASLNSSPLAKSEGKKVKSVQLLGSKAKLKWKQTNDCLTIECPESLPCKTSIVFRID